MRAATFEFFTRKKESKRKLKVKLFYDILRSAIDPSDADTKGLLVVEVTNISKIANTYDDVGLLFRTCVFNRSSPL